MSVRKTHVRMGQISIESSPSVVYHDNMESLLQHQRDDLSAMANSFIEQTAISAVDFQEKLGVFRKLGEGGYGIVYHASFELSDDASSIPCVIKFPKVLLKGHDPYLDISSGDIQVVSSRSKLNKLGKSIFEQETSSLIRIFTPYKRRHQQFYDGRFRLMRTTIKSTDEILREARRVHSNPGYEYLHKFLHFEPSYYAILSEPCVGHLLEAMQNIVHGVAANKRLAALQVGLAVHYLLFEVQLAHTDIKLENIFFKICPRTQQYTFVLSDFGYVDELSGNSGKKVDFQHTDAYIPAALLDKGVRDDEALVLDTGKIMIFTYCISCLHMGFPKDIFLHGNIQRNFVNPQFLNATRLYKLIKYYTLPLEKFIVDFANRRSVPFFSSVGDDYKIEFHEALSRGIEEHNKLGKQTLKMPRPP